MFYFSKIKKCAHIHSKMFWGHSIFQTETFEDLFSILERIFLSEENIFAKTFKRLK